MKCLVAMYDKMDYGVVFFEIVTQAGGTYHTVKTHFLHNIL